MRRNAITYLLPALIFLLGLPTTDAQAQRIDRIPVASQRMAEVQTEREMAGIRLAEDSMPLRVATLNIRYEGNDGSGPLDWDNRKYVVARELRYTWADIIGLQEVLNDQLEDLSGWFQLGRRYAHVGEGRRGGTGGEHNPIFYKRSKFWLLEHGTHWLHPDLPTERKKAWGASNYRIVTYALLMDKQSHHKVYVFNTHFSHGSGDDEDERRLKQAQVLHEFISNKARRHGRKNISFFRNGQHVTTEEVAAPFGEPVIVLGDFNTRARERYEGDLNRPYGMLSYPLNEEIGYGSRHPDRQHWPGCCRGLVRPYYDRPRRLPTMSHWGWWVHAQFAQLKSVYVEWENRPNVPHPNSSLDWILYEDSWLHLQYYYTRDNRRDRNGDPWLNYDGEEVYLSDVHDIHVARFTSIQPRYPYGVGFSFIPPRWHNKSWNARLDSSPISHRYTFDAFQVNALP